MVRQHAQMIWGQSANNNLSLQLRPQEAWLVEISRMYSGFFHTPSHGAQSTDVNHSISREEDYSRSSRVPQGSGVPRYVQGPMELLLPDSLCNLGAYQSGYQSGSAEVPQPDPEATLPPLALFPIPGGKRKSSFIEDSSSRYPSCDSGVRDLNELEMEKESKAAEATGNSVSTPYSRCPCLEGIGLKDEVLAPQGHRTIATPMCPCENLQKPHEPDEFGHHSLELPPQPLYENHSLKTHETDRFRRHLPELQNLFSPLAGYVDGCGPLDTLAEQHIQAGAANGISQKLSSQETHGLPSRPEHGSSPKRIKISSGKEVVSPKPLPQPYSHQQLSLWMGLLPSIQRDYAKIMGPDNNGSIQLLNENGQGLVAVTCQYPKRVRNKALEKKLRCLDLRIKIQKGNIRRSDRCGDYEWPAINGHHTVQPSCGASLGVSKDRDLESSVSLGGYVKLQKPGSEGWHWYATTSHHLLEAEIDGSVRSDDSDDDCYDYDDDEDDRSDEDDGYMDSDELDEDDEEKPTSSSFLTLGVQDGTLCLDGERPRAFEIQSPSKMYHDSAQERLKERMRFAKHSLEDPQQLKSAIGDLEKANTFFGKAQESSGLCIEGNKQMDWLLISDIPLERISSKDSRDWSSFVEGVPRGSRSQPSSRSTFVDEGKFNKLTSLISEYYAEYRDKHCPHSRIHGSGCESGLSDGQLLVPPVVVQLNNMAATTEWTFKPRRKNGLGTFGDSGTWLYTAWGELLGQVLAYDSTNDVAFYTPIYLIFDHIKKRTGASDIRLPTEEDYAQERLAKKSSPSSTQTMPRRVDTLVTAHSTLSSLLTPPEDPGDRDAKPTAHPLACLASEGVCCSHSSLTSIIEKEWDM